MRREGSEQDGGSACTLPEEGLTARMGLWRALAEHALSRTAEPGRILSSYPHAVSGELRTLIEAEAECCPFLSFEIRERGDILDVELRYPLEFEPMIQAVMGGVDIA